MDVPFRGMQRQHNRLYLAALDDPSAEGLASQINFQTYAGRDLSEYEDWGNTGVCTCWAIDAGKYSKACCTYGHCFPHGKLTPECNRPILTSPTFCYLYRSDITLGLGMLHRFSFSVKLFRPLDACHVDLISRKTDPRLSLLYTLHHCLSSHM